MVPKGSARQELKTEEKQLRDYELLLIISYGTVGQTKASLSHRALHGGTLCVDQI
jgi:hypothetical protein